MLPFLEIGAHHFARKICRGQKGGDTAEVWGKSIKQTALIFPPRAMNIEWF